MSEHISVQQFLRDDGMRTLPIACRLVPLDQWLVTHVDTSWKVNDIKQWILSKCNIWGSSGAPQPPRFRPASPVIFSAPSRRSSIDSGSWVETEEGDDKDDEWDVFAALDSNPDMRTSASDSGLGIATYDFTKSQLGGSSVPEHTASASTSSFYVPLPQPALQRTSSEAVVTSAQYTLVSFSNGFVLEDDADLSWYKPRPFELLEVHRAGAIVSLPRTRIAAYAEPYFESAVRVSERPHGKQRSSRNGSLDEQAQGVEWKARWAVVKNGVLHLCKEVNTPPTHRFPISALTALGGPEQFGPLASGPAAGAGTGAGKGRMICARFNRMATPRGKHGDEEDLEGAGTGAQLQKKKRPKTSSWVVLEMPSRSTYENMLRILHRLAPHPLPSSFLPHRAPLSSPISPSPSPSPSPSTEISDPDHAHAHFGVQYPEWRVALVARARAAGRGAVGPALALAQCHSLFAAGAGVEEEEECELDQYHATLPRAPSISESLRRRAEASALASMSTTGERGGTNSGGGRAQAWKDALSEDDASDDAYDEDDVESEVEWDGWVRDLARRASRSAMGQMVGQAPAPAPTSVVRQDTGSSIISPSSPDGSEVDYDGGNTARVRRVSYVAHPHSSSSYPVPIPVPIPILSPSPRARSRSNTLNTATFSAAAGTGTALGARYTYTSTTTTTITTYVDRLPTPASVPGTGTGMGGTWTHHSPLPSPVPPLASGSGNGSSARDTPRARRVREDASGSGQMRLTPPPSASGSRAASVSGSEVGSVDANANANGSTNGRAGLGGVKRIVRGVSIRNAFSTERFVRGLEDALDFVDGR